MEIEYANRKIAQVCTDAHIAEVKYGLDMALKLKLRLVQLEAASNVQVLIHNALGRCHPLKGKRKNQYAMDLVQPYRLIFTVTAGKIQVAEIQEIVDYH